MIPAPIRPHVRGTPGVGVVDYVPSVLPAAPDGLA
jgi:hypothetical protein